MQKQVIRAIVLLLAAIFITFAADCRRTPAFADAEKNHRYTFLTPTYPVGDYTALDIYKMLDRVSSDILKKTGIKIDVNKTNYNKYVEAFFRDKPDFLYMGTDSMLELMRKGINYEPLVLVSVMKGKGAKVCVYATGGVRKLADLKGKTISNFGAGSPAVYMAARKLLFDNGFDMPLDKFFGGVINLPGGNSPYQALLMGKTDGHIDLNCFFAFFSQSIAHMKDIHPVACSEDYPTFGIFMREGRIAPEDAEALRKYLEGLHRNPAIAEMRTMFIAVDAKLVAPDPELMKRFRDLVDESERRGWYDEAMMYKKKIVAMKPGQILKAEKPTYKECKKKCAASRKKDACMDGCMGD